MNCTSPPLNSVPEMRYAEDYKRGREEEEVGVARTETQGTEVAGAAGEEEEVGGIMMMTETGGDVPVGEAPSRSGDSLSAPGRMSCVTSLLIMT